ncbi:MAG: glycerate kinase [Rhodospirillaceae bacterium]|nr:glycerate kinase [Rhodospirillaceae bacterium]
MKAAALSCRLDNLFFRPRHGRETENSLPRAAWIVISHIPSLNRTSPVAQNPRQILRHLFDTAVAATDPRQVVPRFLPARPKGKLIVLGAGKGSGAMAAAADAYYGASASGLVVTRDGYKLPTAHIEVVEAAHPVPDVRSVEAAQRILQIAQTATTDDLVLGLISGGASALMCLPPEGISFAEKQAINAALLKSGAEIEEMNCVRKHLSRIKGGRLALACGDARVLSLIISDVVGDDLSVIASGPTVADPSTLAQARAVLQKYNISVSAAVMAHLESAASETPKVLGRHIENIIVARPRDAFEAAKRAVVAQGLACLDLGDHHKGDVAEVAAHHANVIRAIKAGAHAVKSPCVILSGGEATVRVTGTGTGGSNTQFALELACALEGLPGVYAIACDSDGTDGNGDHAGAIIGPDTLARARSLGFDAARALTANDTGPYFKALGDLVVTGPTYTNVNDFRAILLLEP